MLANIINFCCIFIFPEVLGYTICTNLKKQSLTLICTMLPVVLYLLVWEIMGHISVCNNMFGGSEIGGFILLGFWFFSIGSAVGALRLMYLKKHGCYQNQQMEHSLLWLGFAVPLFLAVIINDISQIVGCGNKTLVELLGVFAPGKLITAVLTILLVVAVGFAVVVLRRKRK